MNEDLLVQMVADHWRSIQPDISNKELVEKFNEAKANPEQFAAEAYKKEKGRMIDKRNLNVFGEALGIQMDPTKLKGISYIGNNNGDVIAAKAEYDRLSQESFLPEKYTDEQFRRAVKEEITPWESIKQGFTSLLPGSSTAAAETTSAAEERVKQKHAAMVDARKKYESLRSSVDGNVLSIEDLYRDSKKDVEIQDMLTSSMSKATASVTPAKAFFDNLPGIGNEKNNLSELSVKMKEKADAYMGILFENLQDQSKSLSSSEEKKLAQDMLSGNFDRYDQNAQYSEEFKKWTKSLSDFGDQKIEFNKIYAQTTGDKKSYDDIYREKLQEEQKKADENDGFFSLIGSWSGTLKESYKSLKRTIVDNVTESDEEELLNTLDKSGKFTDKHLQVLNGYNLQKNIEQIQKIENTVRSSDWGSPIMMNSAIVNGHVLAVDDKHNFMYVVGPDGKTVAAPSIDQQKAIDDYTKNPSAYKVNFGWSATPFKSAINLIGETIAQMVPMIATGAVAAAATPATGGTSAAVFMAAATMFAQQYGNYYEEELQRSGNANKAGQYAALMAGAESVAEVLGGQVEMKFAKALAGKSGRDVIMNAARETANKIAMAKNAANFSVMNEFVSNMAKDVGQEYAEEFGTMIAQSGINAMFGNDSSISMNELVSTLVATPFATMAMSAIPSYQSAREEYKQSLMAAATNIEAFNENLALMVESGKISEEEAKLKYQMVDKLKSRYGSYNVWMKNDKISFTKKEAEKFESLVFDEVFSIKDQNAKDNTDKILALVEEAKKRTYQNRPSEAPAPKIDVTAPDPQASAIGAILNDEDSKDPNDPENPVPPTGGASVPATSAVQGNARPSKIGETIDADGKWGYVEQGVSLADANQHTLHLNLDNSLSVKLPLDRLGVDHLLVMARPGSNRYEGNVELHFKSAEDAKKAYKVLSDAGIKSAKDMSGLIGKNLDNGIVYTQGHFMNRDVAANIIENARDNGDGTFTSTDMFSGNDFTFPAEKMIEYEQIAQGAQKAWDAPEVVPATDNGQVSTELVGTEQRSAAQPAGNNQSNTVPTVTRNRATTDTGIKAGVNTVLDVTAGSPDGLKVVYKNSLATLKVDEGGKVELSTPTKTIELGNIAEIGDVPVASFGVSMMPNANFNNNVIRIGDNLYVNRYSDPTAAINFEEGGVTVDLERIVTTGGYQGRKTTKSYEKVLLTGADAEIAASVIMEHALESNPVFAQDFEEFVSSSPNADVIKQEASQYDTGDTETFDITVRQDVMNYIIDNFQGPLETITAMAELFTLIAERMARTFPEKYPTAVDYFKAKMVGFSSPDITFEILNQFLDGAIESAGNDQVKAELQDIKQFLDDNRSVFVEPEQPATTTGAAGSEQQSGTANQGSQTVPKAVPGGNDVQVLGEDKRADIERRRQEELDELENELKSNGINLGVNDLKQTAEKIIDDIQSPFVKQVLKVLLNLISKTGATLEIVREGGIGYNPSKNRITIGLDTILDGFNRNREARSKGISNGFSIKYGKSEGTAVSYFATTLLHEIVHTFTSKQIDVFTGKSQGNITDEERNI
ncbi:MAG: hypothetical protein E6Q68_09225 [Polynucleobacter sp.]|nr:MAG: hypothetical protein E6Q68_09225 [Polynucleobacter sp.]